jgi:hypothetical protein
MEKKSILLKVYQKIVYQLDNGINSNFNEYLTYYNRINEDHEDSIVQIKESFYKMAFCIEVRKTTKFRLMEKEESDTWYEEFKSSRV